jgi:hypothetical protein
MQLRLRQVSGCDGTSDAESRRIEPSHAPRTAFVFIVLVHRRMVALQPA